MLLRTYVTPSLLLNAAKVPPLVFSSNYIFAQIMPFLHLFLNKSLYQHVESYFQNTRNKAASRIMKQKRTIMRNSFFLFHYETSIFSWKIRLCVAGVHTLVPGHRCTAKITFQLCTKSSAQFLIIDSSSNVNTCTGASLRREIAFVLTAFHQFKRCTMSSFRMRLSYKKDL